MSDKHQPLVDFRELPSAQPGEALEQIVRAVGARRGMAVSYSGRGADGGKDLLFTEILSGPISKTKITWLVSCKDKAKGGASVSEADLPAGGVLDKVRQHKADGFLLVTTTIASTAAKDHLDKLDRSSGGDVHTMVWDSLDLAAFLLEPGNSDLLKQYLPQSYSRAEGLTSLEEAIVSLGNSLPDEVLRNVLDLVRPYSESPLNGRFIWPYDAASASGIDDVLQHLLRSHDVPAAVRATTGIEYDAFVALMTELAHARPEDCLAYGRAVVQLHVDPDMRLNAWHCTLQAFELSPREKVELATYLDEDGLWDVYGEEVAVFVETALSDRETDHGLQRALDDLSSCTIMDGILFTRLRLEPRGDRAIRFVGEMAVTAILQYDAEPVAVYTYPGAFSGYFDASGMYLEEVSVDVSSFYA